MAQVSGELFSREASMGSRVRCCGPAGASAASFYREAHNSRKVLQVYCSVCDPRASRGWTTSYRMFTARWQRRCPRGTLRALQGGIVAAAPSPQHPALADTSCRTTGVRQEIPSHTFLIFYNRAAISATHPERIFNEKRGERACTFPAHRRAEALRMHSSLFLAACSCS